MGLVGRKTGQHILAVLDPGNKDGIGLLAIQLLRDE